VRLRISVEKPEKRSLIYTGAGKDIKIFKQERHFSGKWSTPKICTFPSQLLSIVLHLYRNRRKAIYYIS